MTSAYAPVLDALLPLCDDLPGEPPALIAWAPDRLAQRVADALAAAGWCLVQNGEHLLHQERDRWAMEHTATCREEHGVHRCPLGALAVDGYWQDLPPGTYRIVEDDRGPRAEAVAP